MSKLEEFLDEAIDVANTACGLALGTIALVVFAPIWAPALGLKRLWRWYKEETKDADRY